MTGRIDIDLRDEDQREGGGSACLAACDDATELFLGAYGRPGGQRPAASVTFLDLGIRLEGGPDLHALAVSRRTVVDEPTGGWPKTRPVHRYDLAAIREAAWRIVAEHIGREPSLVVEMIGRARAEGREEGRREIQAGLRRLAGL